MATTIDINSRLRYPENVESSSPCMIFSTFKPNYNKTFKRIGEISTNKSVALYIPQNISVNDAIRYEQGAQGFAGAVLERVQDGTATNITREDIESVGGAYTAQFAALFAGLAGSSAGTVGAVVSGAVVGAGVGNISNAIATGRQQTLNPREYRIFNAPTMRQFSFNFTFIPSNVAEANAIPKIIKFFRSASYPIVHNNKIDYIFPDMFKIVFNDRNGRDINSIIKLPEVVCSSVQVTYNPNSISFYTRNDMPVEITMAVTFEELKPIDRNMVEAGF